MDPQTAASPTRFLITSGPTWEPIDEVRYLGNRSSGRLGVALADTAADLGHPVTLLLGPQAAEPTNTTVRVVRFQTTSDLEAAMALHAPKCDGLIMAAAVADYRPIPREQAAGAASGKIKRKPDTMVLHLESTPDLIAAEASRKRDDQFFVAFALEPRDRLLDSATRKLERKGIDAIVANPLETMGAETIEATLLTSAGITATTNGPITKSDFAVWLLTKLSAMLLARTHRATSCTKADEIRTKTR